MNAFLPPDLLACGGRSPWLDAAVTEKVPALSIGLAVRNGNDVVGRCVESVLSQDFTDFELLIRDNVSDDGPSRCCRTTPARTRASP
jgi:hypothetical protein